MMNNKIGVLVGLHSDRPCFTELSKFGCNVCQLVSWSPDIWSEALAKKVRKEADDRQIRITSLWAGWPGPSEWNFTEGPITLGLVPVTYRQMRIETLIKASGFAHQMGLPAIITHLGFIPENPSDPAFGEMVVAVRQIARHLKSLGMEFWFETGQETPVTMLRLIQAVGTENLGVNLDPANLILYGKGNPVDVLDVFGKYVKNIHAKDGIYPTDPMRLGQEVRVGEGRVRFPDLVRRLKEVGFTGEFIIEREISGEQQAKDIAVTVSYLQGLLNKN